MAIGPALRPQAMAMASFVANLLCSHLRIENQASPLQSAERVRIGTERKKEGLAVSDRFLWGEPPNPPPRIRRWWLLQRRLLRSAWEIQLAGIRGMVDEMTLLLQC